MIASLSTSFEHNTVWQVHLVKAFRVITADFSGPKF